MCVGMIDYDNLKLSDKLKLKMEYYRWYNNQLTIRRLTMRNVPASKKKIFRFRRWLEAYEIH